MNKLFSRLALLLTMLGCLITLTACMDSSQQFTVISKALGQNLYSLQDQPGITIAGFSSNAHKKLFTIGLGIDRKQITGEQLEQAIHAYFMQAAAHTHMTNMEAMLKPYHIQIQELNTPNNSYPLLAEKHAEADLIEWAKEWTSSRQHKEVHSTKEHTSPLPFY